MSLNSRNYAGQKLERERPPAGTYVARCFMVVDLGEQWSVYQDQPGRWSPKIHIAWELAARPADTVGPDDAQGFRPDVVGKDYTLSLGDKANLRKDLETWFVAAIDKDKSFDFQGLLGSAALVTVTHTRSKSSDHIYLSVKAVSAVPRGTQVPPLSSPLTYYDMDRSDASAVFETLPVYLKEKIRKSRQWQETGEDDGSREEFGVVQAAPPTANSASAPVTTEQQSAINALCRGNRAGTEVFMKYVADRGYSRPTELTSTEASEVILILTPEG